jgi:hypothetical protein
MDLGLRSDKQGGQPASAPHVGADLDVEQIALLQQRCWNHQIARHLGKVSPIELGHVAVLLEQRAVEPDLIGVTQTRHIYRQRPVQRIVHFERDFEFGKASLPWIAPVPVVGQLQTLGEGRLAIGHHQCLHLRQLSGVARPGGNGREQRDQPQPKDPVPEASRASKARNGHPHRPGRASKPSCVASKTASLRERTASLR